MLINKLKIINYFKFSTLVKTLNIYNNISSFVQVGAHDGEMHDPLRKFILADNWKGLLIEPQKEMIDKCRHNYKNISNLIFINCAVHPYKTNIDLFKANDAKDYSHTGWASVLPDRFASTQYENNYTVENVKARHLMDIIADNKLTSIDILQIDTEGFDAEVIKMFDFIKFRPLLIQYEHIHFTVLEREAIDNKFDLLGYYSIIKKNDVIVIRKNIISYLFLVRYLYLRILSSIKSRFNNFYNKF